MKFQASKLCDNIAIFQDVYEEFKKVLRLYETILKTEKVSHKIYYKFPSQHSINRPHVLV